MSRILTTQEIPDLIRYPHLIKSITLSNSDIISARGKKVTFLKDIKDTWEVYTVGFLQEEVEVKTNSEVEYKYCKIGEITIPITSIIKYTPYSWIDVYLLYTNKKYESITTMNKGVGSEISDIIYYKDIDRFSTYNSRLNKTVDVTYAYDMFELGVINMISEIYIGDITPIIHERRINKMSLESISTSSGLPFHEITDGSMKGVYFMSDDVVRYLINNPKYTMNNIKISILEDKDD
jgi:hypothetical protein